MVVLILVSKIKKTNLSLYFDIVLFYPVFLLQSFFVHIDLISRANLWSSWSTHWWPVFHIDLNIGGIKWWMKIDLISVCIICNNWTGLHQKGLGQQLVLLFELFIVKYSLVPASFFHTYLLSQILNKKTRKFDNIVNLIPFFLAV